MSSVLVIDDDETLQAIVQAALEEHGFEYTYAMNGEDGLKSLEDEKPDLILLDRKMPGLDGNEVLQKIKENPDTKDIPVIMLTGENAISEVSVSLKLGASDYMVKPFDNVNLIVRIKHVIG